MPRRTQRRSRFEPVKTAPRRNPGSSAARRGTPNARQASVLVVVLVVLAILALGAYTFSEFMIVEAQSTSMYARDAQARAAADSGIELATSLLTQRYEQTPHSYYQNPAWFQGITLQEGESARGRLRFSIVSAVETDSTGRQIRFGLQDESAKLNLNAIPKLVKDTAQQRQMLMYVPGITQEIADAILDWVDADSTQRDYGAEADAYSSLGYAPKNGSLDSLDELLLVQGVTAALLFGEDANRNGLLDAVENDGEVSPPLDNADGLLNHGWSAYLTVHSRESNLKADGTQKINMNMNALGDLYDQIQPILGDEAATFIMAYRLNGPVAKSTGSSNQTKATTAATKSSVSGTGGSATASKNMSASTNSAKVVTSQDASTQKSSAIITKSKDASSNDSQGQGGVQQAAKAVSSSATMAGKDTVTRAGIDVTAGGSTTINSMYDLLDAQVSVKMNGSNNATTIDSPWTSDSSSLRSNIPKLIAALSTSADKTIDGRINVNHARSEVMMGLPNMTPAIVEQIVSGQAAAASSASDPNSDHVTAGWLLSKGIVDLDTMRLIDKYVTSRGDVFRLHSVGYFDQGGPSARIEAVIDATQDPPQVVFLRDLTDLGRGYSPQLLTTGSGGTQ
ncbi:MAG: hypothetical protein EXS05_20410 [Planctomycetaceae bacterium]|nr:hypothetical protein [Planctomycetaceae bacterium]